MITEKGKANYTFVTVTPELRSMQHRLSIYYACGSWKVPPFPQSRDSYIWAQGWLLIMAGDVELNPGPEPPVAIFLSYRHDDRASYVGFHVHQYCQHCMTKADQRTREEGKNYGLS